MPACEGTGRGTRCRAALTDKDAFRAVANRVKDRTGLKGKNLFHPIRVILTGSHEGPESI